MSQADVQRFIADLKSNAALQAEVKSKAAGLGSVLQIAKAHGYNITMDEAKAYLKQRAHHDLSDSQLDAVAGGKGGGGGSPTAVATVQTVTAVTSVAANVEVVSNAAAATNVGAVAEVVAVVAVVFT